MLTVAALIGVALAPAALATWLADPKRRDPRPTRPPRMRPMAGEVELVGRIVGR